MSKPARLSLRQTLMRTLLLTDKNIRIEAVGVGVMILIGVFLEGLGIGIVFPFVSLILDAESAFEIEIIGPILNDLSGGDTRWIVFFSTIVFVSVFLIKNAFLLLVVYVQARFTFRNVQSLAQRLYRRYLYSPYTLHLERNSSDYIRNIGNATISVFMGSFMGWLTIFTEVFVLGAIAVVLFILDPLLTLGVGVGVSIAIAAYYAGLKERLVSWGERTLKAEKRMLQELQQGFHSIKEISVSGRQESLMRDFDRPLSECIQLLTFKQVVTQAPRFWLESIVVLCVMFLVLYQSTKGSPSGDTVAILSVFGAAAFRILPSMNRMLVALNRINDARHAVDVLYGDLFSEGGRSGPKTHTADIVGDEITALELDDISFSYDGASGKAIDAVSLKINKGESIGLVGASGAGKTTIIDILLGLLNPSSGRIRINGQDVGLDGLSWQGEIGYVPQKIYLFDDSLKRNIALGLPEDEIDENRVNEVLDIVQLRDFIAAQPNGFETLVGEQGVRLSGGQSQRIGIARALYSDPSILILDEATSALDNKVESEISKAVETLGVDKTLIIVAHRLSTVRRCKRILFMEDGVIKADGTFEEVMEINDKFRHLVALTKL